MNFQQLRERSYVKYHENKEIYLRCALEKKSVCGPFAEVSASENLFNIT